MIVFIILIFINSNFVNALDESSENRYINQLPEKEKKELLERVARRIIQEVKSNEVVAGVESGEVPEDELKIHSEFVGQLLREERENLNKRRSGNNETELLKTNSLVESTTIANNNNESAKTINDLKITTVKVQSIAKEVLQNDKANDDSKDSLLRNKDESLDKSQEIEKVQDVYNKQESEKNKVPENDNIDNNDKRAVIDLTLRSDAIHDDVKVDEDKVLDFLVDEKQENNSVTQPSRSNFTGTNKTNELINDKLNKKAIDPVSIEITFVNDEEDSKKDKANITDEIPVKVIYDKKLQEDLSINSNLETSKTIPNASNISVESQILKIKKDEITRYRKSFTDGIDENIQEIQPTLDNQIARKKRKSRIDTDSAEIKDKIYNNSSTTTELALNNDLENVTEIDRKIKQTVVETNKNSELSSEASTVSRNDTTPEVTTEKTLSSSKINLSSSFIVNVTTPTLLGEVKEKVETKPGDIPENVTEKHEVQHTQINNFDVDENDTTSGLIIKANYTGTTTEEIVKMRTQHISGYPEDSYENLTTTIAAKSKKEYPRSYPEQKTENVSTANLTISNLRTHFDMNNSSKLSVDSNIKEDTKVPSKVGINSSSDSGKEKKEADFNLNNETSTFKAAKQFTSTTIVPLTTSNINTKKKLYYAMELPVEIKNDSVVAVDNKKVKTYLPTPKSIDNKKPLRYGIRPEDDFKDYNSYGMLKFKPASNPYVVYEILPGQKSFIKKESLGLVQQKSQKRNPASYPKLSLYETNKQEVTNNLHEERPSQIEQPNYAPVYNYAPEYAYYNPRNIYGPNADDENVKIIDERSNEREKEDLDKIFDYDIFKSSENLAPDDSYIITKRNKVSKKTSKLKRVSEDYYFGFGGPDLDKFEKQYTDRLASRKRSKKNKRKRTKKVGWKKNLKLPPNSDEYKYQKVKWKENLKVPPNSDEYEHPLNAMFKKRPPITHNRQVGAILANLGYFGYNHNHLYKPLNKSNPFSSSPNNSSEPWIGPHKTDKHETKKKKFLRSGADHPHQQVKKYSRLKKLLTFHIASNLKEKLKSLLKKKNNTFNLDDEHLAPKFDKHHAMRTQEKKRHLFLLTGNPKRIYNKRKIPMLVLTGRPKENDWNENYNRKPKTTGNFYKNHYVLGQESSESNYKSKNEQTNVYWNGYEDYEDLDGNIVRGGSDNDYNYNDPGDVSEVNSHENNTLASLNMKTVKYILDMSEKNPNILNMQRDLIASLKKQKLLYNPPMIPTVKEYDHILKEHDSNLIYFLRSDKELDAYYYVTVIKDMINMDKNYALENYDWLGSTVDIRSAMKKLAMVSGVINENPNRIHPKDLQLIKYVLYLYSTTNNLLQPAKENDEVNAEKVSEEYPKNKRFAYEENQSINLPKKHKEYIPLQKSIHISRRKFKPITKRPWLNKDGLKERLDELISFVEEIADLLNDLHDAIKHISFIMKHNSQTWFKNLKDLYLSKPSRKTALEVLLHLRTARLIQLIEKSAVNGLDANYVKYSMSNPEEVEKTKEEFALVIKLYLELKKLQ